MKKHLTAITPIMRIESNTWTNSSLVCKPRLLQRAYELIADPQERGAGNPWLLRDALDPIRKSRRSR